MQTPHEPAAQLPLIPDPPPFDGPTHGARILRADVSHRTTSDRPAAFPALSRPKTPLLDQALAEQPRPRRAHQFHSERVLDVLKMRKVTRTWCLACDAVKRPGGKQAQTDCAETNDPKIAAPWVRS